LWTIKSKTISTIITKEPNFFNLKNEEVGNS
jgi:hypothetical protein